MSADHQPLYDEPLKPDPLGPVVGLVLLVVILAGTAALLWLVS